METSLGNKPYKFIPLTSKIDRKALIKHNEGKIENLYSGKMFIKIKTLTPIHISQGDTRIKSEKIINNFMRRNNQIVIPGSSFKGMIRSIFETISNSCTPKLPNDFSALEEALPKKREDICQNENLCPSCSVFGTINNISYRGKIRIGEFKLISDEKKSLDYVSIPVLQTPFRDYPEDIDLLQKNIKKEVNSKKLEIRKSKTCNFGNERLYYADFFEDEDEYNNFTKDEYYNKIAEFGENRTLKFRGRKYYLHNIESIEGKNSYEKYEVVKKDCEFEGYLIFENLTEKELSILSLALGITENFSYKIGYGKPAYFGSISIKVESVKDRNIRYSNRKNILTIDYLEKLANDYKNFSDEEISNIINKLREILSNKKLGVLWNNSY